MSRSARVYVGNLKDEVTENQLQDLFRKHGAVDRVDLKRGFAFVEFAESTGADDAVRELNGKEFEGSFLRVEFSRGRRDGGGDGGYDRYLSERARAPMRSDYRVIVEDLNSRTSWQTLKDHMRRAGDVMFADVIKGRDGSSKRHGVVEYRTYDDMRRAIRELNDTTLEGERIRVEEDRDGRPRDDDRRGTRDYGRGSRDYDYDSRSRKRSRSPEPRSRRSRSYSRSRSRSPVRRRRSM